MRGPDAPVVAGIDGSGPAVRATAWAAQEARLRGRRLTIVFVLGDDRDERAQVAAEQALRRAGTVARTGQPGLEVRTEFRHGDAATELAGLSVSAELLVIGHRGAGGFDNLTGSTATALASIAHCPVVVVRPAPGRPVPDRDRPIVVGVDADPDGCAALEFAVRMADRRGSELLAVHTYVERPAAVVRRLSCRETEPSREAAARLLAECVAGHRERHPDLRIRSELVRGWAPWALLELSDSAQMIIVGRGGRRTGGPVGLCAAGLLRAASCPVVVVRAEPATTATPPLLTARAGP
jgi:nucleotide-binding universal stress UspA family protein